MLFMSIKNAEKKNQDKQTTNERKYLNSFRKIPAS